MHHSTTLPSAEVSAISHLHQKTIRNWEVSLVLPAVVSTMLPDLSSSWFFHPHRTRESERKTMIQFFHASLGPSIRPSQAISGRIFRLSTPTQLVLFSHYCYCSSRLPPSAFLQYPGPFCAFNLKWFHVPLNTLLNLMKNCTNYLYLLTPRPVSVEFRFGSDDDG